MKPEEQYRLMDELLDGAISETDFLRLEAEMLIDPLARQAYYDRVALTASLQAFAVEQPSTYRPNKWQRAAKPALAAAAALVALAGVVFWPRREAVADVEASAAGFAVISSQANAEWGSVALKNGDLLPAGSVKLKAGLAKVEVFSGVTLVVEGPAEFEMLSPMEMRLTAGKLRAHVPEAARGFRARAADGDVVDLGTEFAMHVRPGTNSELHVLDGEVEWHTSGKSARLLKKGDALQTGSGMPISADATAFASISDANAREAVARQTRQTAWGQELAKLRTDPRLLAGYSLATALGDRRILNLASGPQLASAGAVVAAAAREDRWERPNGALDFSPTGSRVRVHVPGTHRSISMLCWVKLNSLDRLYNSLFLTDGHNDGAPHWQITKDGRLIFSIKKSGDLTPNKHDFFSPPIWSPSIAGQWVMLGVVYDVERQRVTHFLNGEALSQESIPANYLVTDVRLGNASIGNWSEPVYRTDAQFAVRNLNGSMDEFFLFGAALTAEAMSEFYNKSRP
jgi:hypothetical protein